MTKGADPELKLMVSIDSAQAKEAPLRIPMLKIDGKIYVPLRSLYQANRFVWSPDNQSLWFEYGVSHTFQAGNAQFGFNDLLHSHSPELPAAVKLVYGELMIPVFDEKHPAFLETLPLGLTSTWDTDSKTLTVHMNRPYAPIS